MAVGKKFSIDFQQATEISGNTQILVQPEGQPVEKASVEQLGLALINENIVPSTGGNYPKMSVGFAENVVGDGSATSEEFSFRPTAGVNRNTLNDGAARIHTLKGSSVVVNQIAKPRVSGSSNGVTWAIAEDGTITLNGTATDQVTFNPFTAPQIIGHKYLMIGTPNDGGANKYYMNNQVSAYDYGAGVIYNSTIDSTNWWFTFVIQPSVSVNFTFKPRLIDLTLMFGAGNEPTTVAEFYQRMPLGADLAAYNEGEIVDGHYGAIKTTGFNQWDEQWELGMFNTSTGEQDISYENIRNVNPIRVLPNTTYYEKQPRADSLLMYVLEYTQDGTYIGFQYVYNRTFTTSPNTAYVNFYMSIVYGTVYNNDICISLYWPTEYGNLYGTYKPYKPFERDLSWVAKYFPNGMRSAGNVADEIRFNSTTQQWEAVQRVDVRPYAAGDESDSAVTTDGTNTNYTLATPTITPIVENINFDYDVSDYGTEELIVAEGVESAPLSASIEYSPNVLAMLKNAPGIANDVDMLKSQLSAITAQLATLTLNNN